MQEGIKIKEDDSVRGRLQDGGGLQVGVNSEIINGCSAEKKMLNIVTTISETLTQTAQHYFSVFVQKNQIRVARFYARLSY